MRAFRRLALVAAVLACQGCGAAAVRCRRVTDFPDGRRVTSDYWAWGGHALADPEIGELRRDADGAWALRGFRSPVDDAGLSAVVSGAVRGLGRLLVP
jgi:hypothetical protein